MNSKFISSIVLLAMTTSSFASLDKTPVHIKGSEQVTVEMFNAAKAYNQSKRQLLEKLSSYRTHKGDLVEVASTGTPNLKEWALLDSVEDSIEGTSTNKAYRDLKLNPGKTIVVAVIDSGVDIKHPDLQGRIWTNEVELNGKPGVDDDGNGYIDDVNGWNFIGGKDGRNVDGTTLEVTREYVRLKNKMDRNGLTKKETKYFEIVKNDFETQRKENQEAYDSYKELYTNLTSALTVLYAAGLKEETVAAVEAITSTEPAVIAAKDLALTILRKGYTSARLKGAVDYFAAGVEYYFNTSLNSSTIIGDDPSKMDDIGYGNPDVIAVGNDHGTHVAGIIGAVRDNGVGMDGQAVNVKIMAVRAVPNGDERDKDVANAVRYAVDNGANVINMSFGKKYSPNKKYVDSAFRYAEKKGVLVVHAAGNDALNIDEVTHYPVRLRKNFFGQTKRFKNWIEVGASDKNKDETLPAYFSNYGKEGVDLFAPGVKIYSTTPDDTYAAFSGTSMATPEVAGVAALVLSQRPDLSAREMRELLMASSVKYQRLRVKLPNEGDGTTMVDFGDLSITGGIVNAYNALEAAIR